MGPDPAQVLGTAKNAIVVWIGIVFLSEKVTWLQGEAHHAQPRLTAELQTAVCLRSKLIHAERGLSRCGCVLARAYGQEF